MKAGSILALYIIFFILKFVWERLLTWLNIRYVQAHRNNPPKIATAFMSPDNYARSVDYTIVCSRFSLVSSTVTSVFIIIAVLSGLLGKIELLFHPLRLGPSIQGILYIYSISLIFTLLSMPFSLYSQFVIEERFDFNRMTLKLFFIDILKNLLVSILIMTPLLFALFWFMDKTGSLWWIWAFLLITVFQIILLVLYPSVIAPLFNKFRPLENSPLKEKITSLANKLKFRTKGIFIIDGSKRSRHSNAYLAGLGKIKRIVLFDTLLNILEENQIVAVLAHEIGHEKKRHILKRIVLSLAGSALGLWLLSLLLNYQPFFKAFGFESPSYHAAIIVFVFFSGPLTFFLKPVSSLWFRKHEYEADQFAVKAVNNNSDLKKALLSLSKDNLSNLTPHPWYSFYHYSHPTIMERIQALDQF